MFYFGWKVCVRVCVRVCVCLSVVLSLQPTSWQAHRAEWVCMHMWGVALVVHVECFVSSPCAIPSSHSVQISHPALQAHRTPVSSSLVWANPFRIHLSPLPSLISNPSFLHPLVVFYISGTGQRARLPQSPVAK